MDTEETGQDLDRRETPRHPIRVVSTRTGMTPSALRAWERRYGVVDPARSEGGQRLYSDADIERLSMLKRVTDAGRSIGDVSALPMDEVRRLAREDEAARKARARRGGSTGHAVAGEHAGDVRKRAMDAVVALDADTLEGLLRRAAASMGGLVFMEDVVSPLLHSVGKRWAEGSLSPAQEHVATAVIRRVLTWMGDAVTGERGPAAVMGTLPGERHELGALQAATAANLAGWAVTFMGGDLPPEEIAAAADGVGARLVGISVTHPADGDETGEHLRDLRGLLPPDVDLVVGGARAGDVVEPGSPGIRVVGSLRVLQEALREASSGAPTYD